MIFFSEKELRIQKYTRKKKKLKAHGKEKGFGQRSPSSTMASPENLAIDAHFLGHKNVQKRIKVV